MRSRAGARATVAVGSAFSPIKESPKGEKVAAEEEWEVRPGGMLVQTRTADADSMAAPVATIRIKVKFGAVYHEIYISSQASFGELKKVLSAKTGLHPLEMKLIYKDKERESTAFLDAAGVKDKSKVVLMEDPTAKAKRLLEMRKTNKLEKAAKSISAISLEVDRLASKVTALEAIVNKGGRVVDNDVTYLIESLMNGLIKLDAIVADGDVKLQRRMQIKRVQKYVETLDSIKIKNAMPKANAQLSKEQPQSPPKKARQLQQPTQPQPQPQQPLLHSIQPQYQQQMQQARDLHQPRNPFQQEEYHYNHQPPPALQQLHTKRQLQHNTLPLPPAATMGWEPLDLLTPSTSTPTSATTTASSTASSTPHARFEWELF